MPNLADHKVSPPECEQGSKGAGNLENRDFAFATKPRPVRDGQFRHFDAEQAGSRQHLGVHEESARVRQQLRQRLSAKHLQGTIAIADARAEYRAGQHVVSA